MQMNDLASDDKPQSSVRLRPHRLRFSLRTLLFMMLVLGAFFGWFGKIAIQARRQQKIVAMIHEMGGEVAYRHSKGTFETVPPRGPWLLRSIFGDAAFCEVEYVHFLKDASDADFARLVGLERLQYVTASGPKITDDGLAHLARLPALSSLNLIRPTITNGGLKQLAGASRLEELSLGGATVSNGTLENIDLLHELRTLQLFRTSITTLGMIQVAKLSKLQSLDV